MKREILFRAWDKVEGKYFEPIYEAYKGNLLDLSISLNGRFLRRTIEIPAEDESCFQDRYILEQFTGLTDKNGVKIFEGDIVKGISNNPFSMGEWREYVVIWGVDHWHIKDTYFTLQELFNYCNNKIEVIGNIHDNPELTNKAMTKFKVGDRFIPRKPKKNNTGLIWRESMDKYDGKELTVDGIDDFGRIQGEESGYMFQPEWCEKVEEERVPDAGKTIDWEQRRWEAVMRLVASRLGRVSLGDDSSYCKAEVKFTIDLADEMIKQLKQR